MTSLSDTSTRRSANGDLASIGRKWQPRLLDSGEHYTATCVGSKQLTSYCVSQSLREAAPLQMGRISLYNLNRDNIGTVSTHLSIDLIDPRFLGKLNEICKIRIEIPARCKARDVLFA